MVFSPASRWPTLLIIALLGLLGSRMGNAQGSVCEDPKAGKIAVTGSATVTETPDTAKVFLSIQVTKPTASEARDEAAVSTNALLAAVGGVQGINAAQDITTSDIQLSPNYIYAQDTGTSRINGYTFTQQLTVKISNLTGDTLGEVVDTAVRAGGNNLQVSSVQVDLSPGLRRSAMDAARKMAVDDAAATARTLAQAAKVTLGPLKSLTDTNFAPPTPIPMAAAGKQAAMAAADAATPVQIGTTDVTATVNAEYAVTSE